MTDKVLERIARDLKREQQARVLRELHRSAIVFRDKTSTQPRPTLDATNLPSTHRLFVAQL